MRLLLRERRASRQPWRLASSFMALSALAPSLSQAITFNPVPSANLDLSNLGRIGIAGDFNGISLYEFEGQIGKPLSTNGSESLLTQLPNGALASIVSTDASIRAMCKFIISSGGTQGVVIGGNFTSLDGTESTAMALFNPNTTEVTPLDGLEGEVNAMFCDQDRNVIYVGGSFKGANSTNAIAWVADNGWTNLPFAGFNGPVDAITKASNGHIIFGGSFTGLGNTSAPQEPDGQTINMSTANISATNSASTNGFSDPKNIICSSGSDDAGSAWLAKDKIDAAWDAKFGFGFEPTKLRLWNTHQGGRGTKTFRYIAFPIDGIMNLTYVDPATGQNATCTSECPLSNDPKVEFQDFHFINRVGMDRFRLAISDWYGDGAGLSGIELFQDNVFSYAINDFNEPSCGDTQFPSKATSTGPWSESPSLQSNAKYLTAKLTGDIKADSASVVFMPNIRESGNYSVNLYTPGCKPDDTCSTRGRVNVTGLMSTGTIAADFTTSLYQTNNFDKYDQIYFGYIEKTSDSFKPSVTITPLAGQDVKELTVVAQRVGFTLLNSTGGLNGLFDFDPDKAVVDGTDLDQSAINKLGASFDRNSGVTSLVTSGDVMYVGGNFTSNAHKNILAMGSAGNAKALDGGLNGQVFDMYLEKTKLYVGGAFSNTMSKTKDGLSHVAVFDIKANTWNTLGGGVDGNVEYVVPLQIEMGNNTTETMIAFTGVFSECKKFGDFDSIPVDGFAVWVPSKGNWLQNLDAAVPSYSGILTAAVLGLPNNVSLYAGSISSAQLGANGAATLNDDGLGKFPTRLRSGSPSSNVTRRDVTSFSDISGVVTGTFYEEGDSNFTVLAGHFTAQGSNGSTINNIMFIDGKDKDSVSGLGSDISADSAFTTVALRGSVLFAGGKVQGTIDGSDISGMIVYDLAKKSYGDQPPSVSGGNGTVSAISVRPDTAEVYVGGSFSSAGALDCPGLCMFNVDSDQWIRPGTSITGRVSSLMWSSKSQLIAGGDLMANGSDQNFLATYDAKKQTWERFKDSDSIPGPVEVMTPASSDNDQIWICGTSNKDESSYLMKFDGKKWLTAKQALSADTVVRSLQVFSLTKGHDKTEMLGDKQVLMLTGSIVIPDVGTVAAAIYNGTHYQPYALTTSLGSNGGTIARIFSQKDNFFSSSSKNMPLVFVVLIGLAIALGLILLLVLGGIILDRLRKRREGYTPAPTSMYDRGSGIQRIPPHELLESLGKSRPGAAPHV